MWVPVEREEQMLTTAHVASNPNPMAASVYSGSGSLPTIAVSTSESIICVESPAITGRASLRIVEEYAGLGRSFFSMQFELNKNEIYKNGIKSESII